MAPHPSFPEFRRLARRFGAIPFVLELSRSEYPGDPFPLFHAAAEGQRESFFLDSFHSQPKGRWSFFPLAPPVQIFRAERLSQFGRTWNALRRYIARHPAAPLSKTLPPFCGGAAGVLAYDAGRFFEKGWRSRPPKETIGFPLLHFALFHDIAALDHERRRIFLCKTVLNKGGRAAGSRAAYETALRGLSSLKGRLRSSPLSSQGAAERPRRAGKIFAGEKGKRSRFIRSVRRIKEYIAAGDIYQANLSQRFQAPFSGSGLNFFAALRQINPSPYSGYFRSAGFELASSSPELLVRVRGDEAATRPIAGTRPRGKSRREDRALKGELLLSEKERAEHIMLVDLERNDLGRVCRAGSVHVTERMTVEEYSHVMHIVSQVEGRLKEGEDIFSAVAAVFPGGTITGCPKVRCMEILDALEPVARGPFFGSMGWIGYSGAGEFNLLIRSALVKGRRIYFQAGSGIVADSGPAREYEESLHKARALLEALQSAAGGAADRIREC